MRSRPLSHLIISPALTMNGSGSDSMSQHFSPPPTYSTTQYSQQQQQQHQHSQQFQHQQQLSISPSTFHFYQPQQSQPQQPQVQGTLSPHDLHSPPGSMMTTMMTPTTTFYPQAVTPSPSESPAPNPQIRQEKFQVSIKPLLLPNSFSGASAVKTLVTQIVEFGSQDVSAQVRLEILTKIRDNAPNHYFRAWSENSTAVDITREWLKAGATAKSDSPLVDTIMPLLHVSLNCSIRCMRWLKRRLDNRSPTTLH